MIKTHTYIYNNIPLNGETKTIVVRTCNENYAQSLYEQCLWKILGCSWMPKKAVNANKAYNKYRNKKPDSVLFDGDGNCFVI